MLRTSPSPQLDFGGGGGGGGECLADTFTPDVGHLRLRELNSFPQLSVVRPTPHRPETVPVGVTSQAKYDGHFSVRILPTLPAASPLTGPSFSWNNVLSWFLGARSHLASLTLLDPSVSASFSPFLPSF